MSQAVVDDVAPVRSRSRRRRTIPGAVHANKRHDSHVNRAYLERRGIRRGGDILRRNATLVLECDARAPTGDHRDSDSHPGRRMLKRCPAPQPLPRIDPAQFSAAADAILEATRRSLRSSAKVLTTVTVTNADKRYTVTIQGSYDLRSERGRLTVLLPGGGIDRVHVVFTSSEVYVDRLANMPEGAWAVSPRDQVKTHYLLRTPANDPGAVVKQVAESSGHC
jgi:hypothetical protein